MLIDLDISIEDSDIENRYFFILLFFITNF